MDRILLKRLLLIIVASCFLGLAAWSSYNVYIFSHKRATIKKDYGQVNNITFGLLSVNAWRDHVVNIVTHRIDDFEFTPEQEDTLRFEVEQVLNSVVNKADSLLELKQKSVKGKLRKFAIKSFVSEDKLREQVPVFAKTIVDELKKPKNRSKLKYLARSKLEEFGSVTYDSANDVQRVENILHKYGVEDLATFNNQSVGLLDNLQSRTYFFAFIVLGVLVLFLLTWWLLRNQKELYTPFFVMSVLLAFVVLFVGLTTPMIEIDARIKELSFSLIGERISFSDQVIFFQSKSIVDVVVILLQTGKYDSAFVGVLILIFSIVFPIGKLLATNVYLLGKSKIRNNKFVQYFAFKSGKWSMADVNVIAIFMAYIGFKGILDTQLSNLNMQTDSLASISTNNTSLQPGFILFVAFVLFGLVLSGILHKITERNDRKAASVAVVEQKGRR